ncbi:hypothetical protein SL040_000533 [Aeromonas salmonicida]|uniref:Uncharacterized protein n=1 Tax=Aeromonas phage vB_AsaM_LPM4 TaxID=2894367 RepID=A0AAE8YHE4_9CAUD|nr:hypothetical protein [Aeromonas salmonicida]YP_010664452.1 hypothetical protein PQA71_gp10 [Aeromonas phage vB_AsaM_LPM4]ELY1969320.1 hypothetical protein [Aeromonas salmonicida]ELY2000770.1 hypothetical protein [Aeromonas salmonicida]MCR4453758.1 hypothetical protein [Aeromonas salmonicida]UGC97267.1 hypothetical protein [Aeromonas phage vB_AsaM_LPM4]
MIYRYAVMSGSTVVGISQYTMEVDDPRLIPLEDIDVSIGDIYNGSEFAKPAQEKTVGE